MQVTADQLVNTCFQNEQQRLNAYAQALSVLFPLSATAWNYGSAFPSVDQQDLPWYRTNSDGTPDGIYSLVNGYWIRPHPTPASAPIGIFYRSTLESLATYDGGEGSYTQDPNTGIITPSIAISATTGPMWQVDTDMYGAFPLSMPDPSITVKDAYGNKINNWTLNQSGGEIQHTLVIRELAPHSHLLNSTLTNNTGNTFQGGGHSFEPPATGNSYTGVTGGDTINGIDNTPVGHNNMPPYRVGWWIKRTARVFYRL